MAKYRFAYDSKNRFVDVKILDKSDLFHPYTCIHCNSELIPKLGPIKEQHFAHKALSECSYESYLHSAAKSQIYSLYTESLENKIPYQIEILQYATKSDKNVLINKRTRTKNSLNKHNLVDYYDEIFLEKVIENYRPDIALYSTKEDSYLFIEITVSNQVSYYKKNSGYRIIEITIEDESDITALENRILTQKHKNMSFYNFRK